MRKVDDMISNDIRGLGSPRRGVGGAAVGIAGTAISVAAWEVQRGISETLGMLTYQDVAALGTTFTSWTVTATGFSINSSTGVLTADLALDSGPVSSIEVTVDVDGTEWQITVPITIAPVRSATFTVFIGHTDTFDVASDATIASLGTSFSGWTVGLANYSISSAGVLTADIPSTDPGTQGSVPIQVTVDGETGTIYVPLQWGTIHPAQSISWAMIRGLERTFDVSADATIAALGTTFSDWSMTAATGFSIESSTGIITGTQPWVGSVISSLSVTCRIDGAPASITVSLTARDAFMKDMLTGYTTLATADEIIFSFYSVNRSYDGTARELYEAEVRDSSHATLETITVSSGSDGYADVSALETAMGATGAQYAVLTEWKDSRDVLDIPPATAGTDDLALICYNVDGTLTWFQHSVTGRYFAEFGYNLNTLTNGAVSRTITQVRYHLGVGSVPSSSWGLIFLGRDGNPESGGYDRLGDNNSFPGFRKRGTTTPYWELHTSASTDPPVTPPTATRGEYMMLFGSGIRFWTGTFVSGTTGRGQISWRSLESNSIVAPAAQTLNLLQPWGVGREMQASNFRVSDFCCFDIPHGSDEENLFHDNLAGVFARNAAAVLLGAVPTYS